MRAPLLRQKAQEIRVGFKKDAHGRAALAVVVTNVEPVANGDRSVYLLVDKQVTLKGTVVCDGMKLVPKLIVKLYCKVPAKARKAHQRQLRLESLRARKPIML